MAQDTFSEFWGGFGVVLAYFVLTTPPAQCRAVVWVIGPLNCGTGQSFFVLFSSCRPPPRLEPGAIWGILATLTVAQDCVTRCVRVRPHVLAPPPLAGDMTVVSVDVFPYE